MTSREARTIRRAEERKAKKLQNRARGCPLGQAVLEPGFVSQPAPEPSKRAEINRANSLHSTGPKTPDGKLASSGNSLKHGLASGTVIICGEDPAEFDALLNALLEEHQPANVTEELLVKGMAQSYWLTQRALRFQNECFTENGLDEKRLSLFLRYQTTHDRAFHKALAMLLRLKNCRGEACLARSQNRNGFVSQDDSQSPGSTGHRHPVRLEKTPGDDGGDRITDNSAH